MTTTLTESGDVHMLCSLCKNNLAGMRYVLHELKPYCVACYENNFSHICENCKKLIGTDHKDLAYQDKHWHEACFFCCMCNVSLTDRPFAFRENRLYCPDCHEKYNASKCDYCHRIFKVGMKKFEFSGKQWHEECFNCKECQTFIGNNSFIVMDEMPMCVSCYENKYAFRCTKCKGVINRGGLKCKDLPWHRECFNCTNCSKPVADEKYTLREEKPYCIDCFGVLFAKKCFSCEKPIMGLGSSSKYVAFEERSWHSECFTCKKCNKNLVGKAFLTKADAIFCPSCGKAYP